MSLQRKYTVLAIWLAAVLLVAPNVVHSTRADDRFAPRRSTVEPTDVVAAQPFAEYQELQKLLKNKRSTHELLDLTEDLYRTGRLGALGYSSLRWTYTFESGWRWESTDASGMRTILAVEGPLIVAIRLSRSVEMSIRDLSRGEAVSRGFADSPRYFGHTTKGTKHVTALSVKNFSRTSPELFKYFSYFAGPTRELVDRNALPRSPIDFFAK